MANYEIQKSIALKLKQLILTVIFRYENEILSYGILDQIKYCKADDPEEIFRLLKEYFKKAEEDISPYKYTASSLERMQNRIMLFADAILKELLPKHKEWKDLEEYKGFLSQKFIAYRFFCFLNGKSKGTDSLDKVYLDRVLATKGFHRILYLGLIEFYKDSYGHLAEREEAIEFLCTYYKMCGLTEVVPVLYQYFSAAGTPEDRGYAHRGIEWMKKYLKHLPEWVVIKVLQQYSMPSVIRNAVYRNQIYTMIEFSQIKTREKNRMKFYLLDSVILADQITRYFGETEGDSRKESHSFGYDDRIYDTEIQIAKNPRTYWKNFEGTGERSLFCGKKHKVSIYLWDNEKIIVRNLEEEFEMAPLPFAFHDWRLDVLFERETEEKLRNFIMGEVYSYKQMVFSLLYLDGYRGMREQVIDFDHSFQYDKEKKLLKYRERNRNVITHFYGDRVYSLSCIVGKNGAGKTSTVDFLRESFFKLLKMVGDSQIDCEGGCVRATEGILDKGAQFVVVWKLDEDYFFLTNINGVGSIKAKPFKKGMYHSDNEYSKIAFFSNMLKADTESLFLDEGGSFKAEGKKTGRQLWAQGLSGFRQIDYSETESFIRKRQAIGEADRKVSGNERAYEAEEHIAIINKELCYQLTFLRNMEQENLCRILELGEDKEFSIKSKMEKWKGWLQEHLRKESGWQEKITFKLKEIGGEWEGNEKMHKLEEYIFLPDAQIRYFSSGQYAKFSFLSKLYWFLEGYEKDVEKYKKIPKLDANVFSNKEALLEGETALIFIDEGELYYHPEWQRRYIHTLLKMVNAKDTSSKIQIILTTNSPFIISDLLQEDVMYLTDTPVELECSFGQNIHRLLKENFFMDNTIGEFAKFFIESLVAYLSMLGRKDEVSDEERITPEEKQRQERIGYIEKILKDNRKDGIGDYSVLQTLIRQIGDPVYRYELERLLEKTLVQESLIEKLEEEKRKIEQKIEELRMKENDTDRTVY